MTETDRFDKTAVPSKDIAFNIINEKINSVTFEIGALIEELSLLAIKSNIKDEANNSLNGEHLLDILKPLKSRIEYKKLQLIELNETASMLEPQDSIKDIEDSSVNINKNNRNVDSIIPPTVLPKFIDTLTKMENINHYNSINNFLKRFEAILKLYNVDVDLNFKRYLPACFQGLEYDWVISNIIDQRLYTYLAAKKVLINHYSTRSFEEESIRVWNTKMGLNEPIHRFVDRFIELVKSTATNVNRTLINHFIRLLPSSIQKDIERTRASNPNVDHSLREIGDLAITFQRIEGQPNNNYSYKNYNFNLNSQNRFHNNHYGTRTDNNNLQNSKDSAAAGNSIDLQRKYSNYNNRIENASSFNNFENKRKSYKDSNFVPTCFKCNGPHYANVCNKPRNNITSMPNNNNQINKNPRLNNIHIENDTDSEELNLNVQEYYNLIDSINHELDEEIGTGSDIVLNQIGVEANNSESSLINIESIQFNEHDRLPEIPILINKCKTKALVDTGAEVSFIDVRLAEELNIDIIKTKGDIILAGNLKLERIGKTAELEIEIPNKKIAVGLELAKLEDAKVIIGMDIMSQLGIALIGLPSSFVDESKEDVDTEERVILTENDLVLPKLVLDSIESNKQISPKSFCNLTESVITLPTKVDAPVYRRQYNIPDTLKAHVTKQVDDWLQSGTIKEAPCNVSYNNPLTIVTKKDKDGNKTKYRVCIDPRLLNNILTDDKFPIPLIKDIFKELKDNEYYTKIDLKDAFNSLKIEESDQPKTAFTWNNTQYVFVGCPFGIKTIPNKFQRITNLITKNKHALGYLDDIIVYSKNFDDHILQVKELIDKLTKHNLKINLEKSEFFKKETILLGFKISTVGISIDPKKLEQIEQWPLPTTGKQMERYLGLVNYFRNHIPKSSSILAELNAYKKIDKFILPITLQNQFKTLIRLIVNAPTLNYADSSKDFKLATDASNAGISAVLFQGERNKETFISFNARVLNKHEKNYSTTRKELLAIVYGLKEFNDYIYGRRITIYTDHKALVFMKTQKNLNSMLNNWLELLNSYNYDIVHLPGIENILPDHLSRIFLEFDIGNNIKQGKLKHSNQNNNLIAKNAKISTKISNAEGAGLNNLRLMNNSVVKNPLLNDDDDEWLKFEEYQKISDTSQEEKKSKQNEMEKKETDTNFSEKIVNFIAQDVNLDEDMKTWKQKKESCHNSIEPKGISKERHDTMEKYHLAGHFGANKMYAMMINDDIKWKGLKHDLLEFVKGCPECARNTIHQKGYHPLKPINSKQQFDHIAIDLLGPLQTTNQGNNYVLVIVDVFTRFIFLFALPDKQAETVAIKLVKLFCLFGFPKIIQSDNGTEFKNKLIDLICVKSKIDHRLITPYHPRGNGLAERNVQTVTHMLRKLIKGNKREWDQYIDLVQLYVNNNINKIHLSAPFHIMFGRKANELKDYSNVDLSNANIKSNEFFNHMQTIVIPAIHKRMTETQKATKDNFDANRNQAFFKPGDYVMTINLERKTKLDQLYNGPFKIIAASQNGSYSLANLDGSLLKRNYAPSQLKLVSKSDDGQKSYEIKRIVDDRINDGDKEYLIEWLDETLEPVWTKYEDFDSTKIIADYEEEKWIKNKNIKIDGDNSLSKKNDADIEGKRRRR